jgi:WD40 repeat protein
MMVKVLACVHDEVLLYGIPLNVTSQTEEEGSPITNANGSTSGDVEETKKKKEGKGVGQETMVLSKEGKDYLLLGSVTVGTSRGANVSTYTSRYVNGQIIHLVGVGCEDGTVIVYHMLYHHQQQQPSSSCGYEFIKLVECYGHDKAVCSITFHPRGSHVLSSAKDGTARIFSVDNGGTNNNNDNDNNTPSKDVACLSCEIHDPNGPPPPPTPISTSTDIRMMKRPPQIIVRGSYFVDLEGKVIYTIASGKRGPTYLTKWNVIYDSDGGGSGSNNNIIQVELVYRKQCSHVPISSTSLSSDGYILTMGSVEGSILLYSLENNVLLKEYKEVHDMPVTCVASRPIPMELLLPGDTERNGICISRSTC